MSQWFMVTLVGKDQIGIVSKITMVLYQVGCHLGETSMLRLGGNFTIMMMVSYTGLAQTLENLLAPLAKELQLHIHIDAIEGQLHQHQEPTVRISVHGADRAGIVAQVTQALAQVGLNILNLESDVGGDTNNPFYVMHLEGTTTVDLPTIEMALQNLLNSQPDLKVTVQLIETVMM